MRKNESVTKTSIFHGKIKRLYVSDIYESKPFAFFELKEMKKSVRQLAEESAQDLEDDVVINPQIEKKYGFEEGLIKLVEAIFTRIIRGELRKDVCKQYGVNCVLLSKILGEKKIRNN